MADGDGNQAFGNEGHELNFALKVLEFSFDLFDVVQDHLQGVLSRRQGIGLNDHGLPRDLGHLYLGVHRNVLDARFPNDLIHLVARGQAFSEILVFDKDSEREVLPHFRV